MASKKRAKDIHRFLKSVDSFSNGQAKVVDWDSDMLEWVILELRPYDGPYKGGRFKFEIKMHEEYPNCSPEVNCLTNIYHPNIDPESECSNVCLNLLDEWESTFGLDDLVTGLLWLLYNPNIEDPLSPYFDPSMEEADFLNNVADSLRGKDVEGVEFGVNFWEGDILLKLEDLTITQEIEGGGKVAGSNVELADSGANSDSSDKVVIDANSQNSDIKDEVISATSDLKEEVQKTDKIDSTKPEGESFVDSNASSADANAEVDTDTSNTDTANTEENKDNETDSNATGADTIAAHGVCESQATDAQSDSANSDSISDVKTDCVQINSQESASNDTERGVCESRVVEPLDLNMVDVTIQPDRKLCDITGDDTMGRACDVTMADSQVHSKEATNNVMKSPAEPHEWDSSNNSITEETSTNCDTDANASDNDNDSFHDCFSELGSSSSTSITDTTSQSSSDVSTSTEPSSSSSSLNSNEEEEPYKDPLDDYDELEHEREYYYEAVRMRRISERERREENENRNEDEKQEDECEDECEEEEQGEIINENTRRKKIDHTVAADILDVDEMIKRVEELMITAVEDLDDESTKDSESAPPGDEQTDSPSFLDGDAASASAGAAGTNDEIVQETETNSQELNNNHCTCANSETCNTHHVENHGVIRQMSKVDRQISVKSPMEEDTVTVEGKEGDFGSYLDMYGTCTFVDPAFDRYVAVVTSTVAYAWDSVVR